MRHWPRVLRSGFVASIVVLGVRAAWADPVISTLTPNSAVAAGPDFTLTVDGSGFPSVGAQVLFDGAVCPTTYVSPTRLTAVVSASYTSFWYAHQANITVKDTVANMTSSAVSFNVIDNNSDIAVALYANTYSLAADSPVTYNIQVTNYGPAPSNAIQVQDILPAGFSFVSVTTTQGTCQNQSGTVTCSLSAGGAANTIIANIYLTVIPTIAGQIKNTVSIINPGPIPDPNPSNNSMFQTINVTNPSPILSAISPTSVVFGSAGFTLTLSGNNFVPGSQVLWNGAPHPTTYISATQLSATISASDIAAIGVGVATISNPAPSGGLSAARSLTITDTPLSCPAGDPSTFATPRIVSYSAIANTLALGQKATLSWVTDHAAQVSIDQGIGTVAPNGTIVVSPLATTVYTLTVKNAYGATISQALPVTIQCNVSNCPAFSSLTGFSGTANSYNVCMPDGSCQNPPPTDNSTHWCSTSGCILAGGPAQIGGFSCGACCSGVCTQIPQLNVCLGNTPAACPSPLGTFSVSNATIAKGQSTILSWNLQYMGQATIDNNIGSLASGSGSLVVSPSVTTTYTLTAQNQLTNQPVTYQVTVTVACNSSNCASPNVCLADQRCDEAPGACAAAGANPNPVNSGTTTSLSVVGADPDDAATTLTYHWTAPASVSLNDNGTSYSARNNGATFPSSGTYHFSVRIADPAGANVTSSTDVVVNQIFGGTITVIPANANVLPNQTQSFSATAYDQFDHILKSQPTFTWSTSGGGVMNTATGLFTAGATPGGPFTITASYGGAAGHASVVVGSYNAPTANGQSVPVPFQTATSITLAGVDHNIPSLPLSYLLVANPTHGTLSGTAPNYTYTPANGYAGPDSFTFKVNNGYLDSNVATVSITVGVPTSGAPTANAQSVNVPFQTATGIVLAAVDHNTPPLPLVYTVIGIPSHGILSGTAPNLTYTPSAGYAGSDSFTFKANNGFTDSNVATISIAVGLPTAGAPTANAQSVSVAFQTPQALTLTGVDHNTPPLSLTFALIGNPSHGTLSGTAPNLTYTPANGYAGADSFTFKVNNGFQDSTPATISINVGVPTAGAPTANAQSVSVPFQTAVGIALTGLDHNTPPLPLIYTVVGNPVHGTLSGTGSNVTYTPANGYTGPDAFTFKANNGFQDSSVATVSLTVGLPTAGAPTASAQSVAVPFQTASAIDLSAIDHNTPPLPLSYSIVGTPVHGTLSGTAPNLTYTPATGYAGPDSFTFKANNGFQDSNVATIAITVSGPSTAPTANGQSLSTPFQTALGVPLTGNDPSTPPLPLTYILVGNPSHGTLSGAAPNLTYTPANGFAGPDSFTFKVNNGFQDSNVATVSITVGVPTAGAPSANAQSVSVPFQTATGITLTGVDHNSPPLPLGFAVVGNPSHGTLSGTGSTLTYTPANGYAGPDSFTFKVNNGFQDSALAAVSITVGLPTAGAPTAAPQTLAVSFQTPTTVTLSATDHNTPPLPLTYSIVASPAHGTLSGSAPNVTYTPANGYTGPDSFSFKASNGFSDSNTAVIALTVGLPTAGAPTANNQSVAVVFQTAKSITLTGSDHNTPPLPLSFALIAPPTHGVLSGTVPNVIYTPANGFAGIDSFTFKVNNGFQDSSAGTVTLTVDTPTVGAPTANGQSVSVPFQTAIGIVLSGVDHNIPPLTLTYAVTAAPTHGTLSGTAPNVTYTPANGFAGSDSFTFKVNNGFQDSSDATVRLTVGTPTAGAPTANAQSVSVPFQTAVGIVLSGADHNTPPLALTYALVTSPAHGTLSGTAPNLTYTPANGYAGSDSFTFKVNNGFQDSPAATVSISVGVPTVGAPTAYAQSVTVPFQTAVGITLTGVDHNTPPLALAFTVLGNPAHGTLSGTVPNVTYTPANGFAGSDSFTFKVNNGFQDSTAATVSITVNTPTAGAPTANAQSVTVPFQTTVGIALSGVDHNTPPLVLNYAVVTAPSHGTLSGTAPNLTYQPVNGYSGPDSFTFKVNNGFQDSAAATVAITVSAPSTAPTADAQSLATPFQTTLSVTLTGHDPSTPPLPLTFALVGNPAHGIVTGTAPNLTYKPANGYAGPDSFTFKVNNGFQDSNVATVSITVGAPTAGAPTATPQSVTVPFQTPVAIVLSGVDHNTPPLMLAYSLVGNPAHGTLTGTAPNFTYTPTVGYSGADSFTFKVNNGFEDSNVATVSIIVEAPSTTPTAIGQTLTTPFQTALPITLSGHDPSTPPLPLTFALVSSPVHGTLTGTAPNVSYKPANGFVGSDSFTFKVNNGFQDSNVATVSITVAVPTVAPTANAQSITIPFQTAVGVQLTGFDSNTPPLPLTYSVVGNPAHGSLSGNAPNLTYSPTDGYAGPDSLTFKVNNGFQDSNVATVNITVQVPTASPVADSQSVAVTLNTPKAIALTASDSYHLPLTYQVVGAPSHGTLSGSGAQQTYTPQTGYLGPDSFTFQANDGFLSSNIAVVSITVSLVGAPTAQDKNVSVPFNGSSAVTLVASDPANLPLTYGVVSAPLHGTLSGSGASQTYTSATDYEGPDSFTFKVNNGYVDSNVATVSITVQPRVLDHITVEPDGKTIHLGDSVQFIAHAFDQNNQEILGTQFSWQVLGTAGTISGAGSFHSIGGFYGTRQYTVVASETGGKSGKAKVTVLNPSPYADDICGAVAYPVPYKSTSGLPGVTFSRLAAGSKIRIFTSTARIVRTLYSQNGEDVVWDVRNDDGDKVASWVYFYIIEQNGPCDKKEGKLVIVQ